MAVGDDVFGYFQYWDDVNDYDECYGTTCTLYGPTELALSLTGDGYHREQILGEIHDYSEPREDFVRLTSGEAANAVIEWDQNLDSGTGRMVPLHQDVSVWFSWQAVPEPSALLLLAMALPMLWRRRR